MAMVFDRNMKHIPIGKTQSLALWLKRTLNKVMASSRNAKSYVCTVVKSCLKSSKSILAIETEETKE